MKPSIYREQLSWASPYIKPHGSAPTYQQFFYSLIPTLPQSQQGKIELEGIHETLEKLPEGYQTQIGEHGTGLSGGAKTTPRHCPCAPQATQHPDI